MDVRLAAHLRDEAEFIRAALRNVKLPFQGFSDETYSNISSTLSRNTHEQAHSDGSKCSASGLAGSVFQRFSRPAPSNGSSRGRPIEVFARRLCGLYRCADRRVKGRAQTYPSARTALARARNGVANRQKRVPQGSWNGVKRPRSPASTAARSRACSNGRSGSPRDLRSLKRSPMQQSLSTTASMMRKNAVSDRCCTGPSVGIGITGMEACITARAASQSV
jgi:hypothetical protein